MELKNDNISNYICYSNKYSPLSISDCFSFKKSKMLNKFLNTMNVKDGIQNVVLYGPAGCGKYTILMLMLNKCYKNICNPYRISVRAVSTLTGGFVQLPSSKNKIKDKIIYVRTSKLHCEIELNQPNIDKALLLFLDYYSSTRNIYLNTYKYIILRNIEYLKRDTQNSLRRIIEIYQTKIRFLVTINSITKLIMPLRSRFIPIKTYPPSVEDSLLIIKNISIKENLKISKKKKMDIINKSLSGTCGFINLHKLFLCLEGSSIISKTNKIINIYSPYRNIYTEELINSVKKGDIDLIRNIIYNIYGKMKDNFKSIIIYDFYREMLNEIKDNKKFEFIRLTSEWDSKINQSYIKDCILNAEGYIYSVCNLYHSS